MNDVKKIGLAAVLIFVISALPGSIFSQATRHPNPKENLTARWEWAKQEAAKHNLKQGYWIGYSIERLMGEHQYIYATDQHTISGSHFTGIPKGDALEKILSGKVSASPPSAEEQVKNEAKRALDRMENPQRQEQKVWKDVAVLYKFGSVSSGIPVTIRVSNLYLPFDPEGLHLFWLDKTDDTQSLVILENLYAHAEQEKLKKRILTIAGLHGTSEQAVAFLEKVLNSGEPDSLRARAASELGDQNHKKAVTLLHRAAKEDSSHEVRKRAVYGLEDIDLPSADDALIDIAHNGKDWEIRKGAIDCLADIASQKAGAALKDVADNDEDTDIQKRAVYALEDLDDNQGIPFLAEIAKTHPKLAIRKAAIYCLGDSDDPRALQALVSIIKNKQ
jgi:HEAT repeat protein